MPEPEQETAPTAGISPPEEVDVAALFARLKEEVRHAPGLDVSEGFNRGLVRTRLRSVAERWWPVTAERPLEGRPGPRGLLRLRGADARTLRRDSRAAARLRRGLSGRGARARRRLLARRARRAA